MEQAIERGARIEAEEHHMDMETARKTAREHLAERSDYYEGLEVVEHAPSGYWLGQSGIMYWRLRSFMVVGVVLLMLILIYRLMTGGGWLDILTLIVAGAVLSVDAHDFLTL